MWIRKAEYDKMVETIAELSSRVYVCNTTMANAVRNEKKQRNVAEQARADAIHWKDKYIDLQWRAISMGWERVERRKDNE